MIRPAIRRRGTTLVEVLVVIVILTVGILAVIQIFPKGFQVLSQTRATSQAAALARSEAERLKNRQDTIPEAILPINFDGTIHFIDPTISPDDMSPLGDAIDGVGRLIRGGTPIGGYARYSGANKFRRILGETSVIPSPRAVTADDSGGLLLLQYGPIDNRPVGSPQPADGLLVTSNPMVRIGETPDDLAPDGAFFRTGLSFGPFDFFSEDLGGAAPAIYVPASATAQEIAINLAVALADGGRRDVRGLIAAVPARTATNQVARIDLAALVVARLGAGTYRIDPASVRPAYRFRPLVNAPFPADDPFLYKTWAGTGALLFSPLASGMLVSGPNGRSPLSATVDYTVADWRNLTAELRVVDSNAPTLRLPLGRLKVGTERGIDGLTNGVIADGGYEAGVYGGTQSSFADNLVVIDTETGGIVNEGSASGQTFVTVNKSSGVVTLRDADPTTPELDGILTRLDGTSVPIDLARRSLRFIYRVKEDWAVAPLKAAARYSPVVGTPGAGQFSLQGTRLFFPRCDAGARVSLGTINFVDSSGVRRQVVGQDAVIGGTGNNATGLPFVDLATFIGGGTLSTTEPPVTEVRGSGMAVRLVRFQAATIFNNDGAANLRRFGTLLQTMQRTRSELTIEPQGVRL